MITKQKKNALKWLPKAQQKPSYGDVSDFFGLFFCGDLGWNCG